jgi:CDP-diacylglycerol--glycerol-3-phosphate 3-phosphatidyltransferase
MFQNRNIPNLVTLTRFLLCFPLIVTFNCGHYHATFLIYVIQELLDFIDGKIAYVFDWRSRFGDTFDTYADCICHFSAFAFLLSIELIPLWFFLIVIYREITISFLRLLGERQKVTISGEWQGKIKAMCYVIIIALSLWNISFGGGSFSVDTLPWIYIAAAASISSGGLYLLRYRGVIINAWDSEG